MPGSDILVRIALGLAAIGAVVFVLRWTWNARRREGASRERAQTLEESKSDERRREDRAREEEKLSHAKWKRRGRPGPRRQPRSK